ncbi:cystathionine beta-lyase [Anaplasma centrale str. Israel]|uniref:Cystathionine beta-lyase n=1 Tax=Anaplasma centrale (strain Israel) TaxID=574556 RepID=D1ASP5_ANACI|nr:PLP-dependent transferase [Anaplasma centrale]ACZ49498.1 cystathionine beta-lyase [Anaplasma centrale str. Israel]
MKKPVEEQLAVDSSEAKGCGVVTTYPVYRRSTVPFSSVREVIRAYGGYCNASGKIVGVDASYGNIATPSCTSLADDVRAVDGGRYALLFPSGLLCLAMACVTFSDVGSHVLVPKKAYFKLHRFIKGSYPRLGRSVSVYESAEDVPKLANEKTSLILIETLSSYGLVMEDVSPIIEFAKKRGIVVLCDNSCIPTVFNPFEYGADVVMYSLTKYFGGHSDVMMGALVARDEEIFERLYVDHRNYGIYVSSDDCYLVQRGMKTMRVRMQQVQSTAIALVARLQAHKKVSRVVYPGSQSYPHREVWERHCRGKYGLGLVNVVFDRNYSVEEVDRALEGSETFKIGLSWGGCRSLVIPLVFNGSLIDAPQLGIDGLRVYCGLEDQEEIISSVGSVLSRLP